MKKLGHLLFPVSKPRPVIVPTDSLELYKGPLGEFVVTITAVRRDYPGFKIVTCKSPTNSIAVTFIYYPTNTETVAEMMEKIYIELKGRLIACAMVENEAQKLDGKKPC